MLKLNFIIISTLILTTELIQEDNFNNIFTVRNCGTNSPWPLPDYESLKIASPYPKNSKCFRSGLENCASTDLSHFYVGHHGTVYLRLYSEESGLKITLFAENDLPRIASKFNKFDIPKGYTEGCNEIILNSKKDFINYVNFLGISNKDNNIISDFIEYNNGKKATTRKTEGQIRPLQLELESSYNRVKREIHNLNSISTQNPSQNSDKIFRSKDLIQSLLKTSDLKVLSPLLNKIFKPGTLSATKTTVKPERVHGVKAKLQSGLELESKLGTEAVPELGLAPVVSSDLIPEQELLLLETELESESGADLDTILRLEPTSKREPKPELKPESEFEPETVLAEPDLDPGAEIKSEENLKPKQDLNETLNQNLIQNQNEDENESLNQNQNLINDQRPYWNSFTITLVTVIISIVFTVCLVGAYHLGKIIARSNNQFVLDDIQPRIIIPRIRSIHRHPLNYGIV